MTSRIELSLWDQAATRAYIPLALCFPSDTSNNNPQDIFVHITQSLTQLALTRPDFGGRLILAPSTTDVESGKDSIFLDTSSPSRIPFERLDVDFPYSYKQLEHDGFPAHVFVNPELLVSPPPLRRGAEPVPVSQLRLLLCDGVFILLVYFHHSYFDGKCADLFLHHLGAATIATIRDEPPVGADLRTQCRLSLPHHDRDHLGFEQLLAQCPEYAVLEECTGPTQPNLPRLPPNATYKTTGKTFLVNLQKLDEIRNNLAMSNNGVKPTQFALLSALTWAHTTKARLTAETEAAPHYQTRQPVFSNPHDWSNPRKRLFAGNASMNTYFGNSVAIAIAQTPSVKCGNDLVDACTWVERGGMPSRRILEIANAVTAANRAIDEDFVLTRTALFASMPEIRRLGVAADSRAPHTFSMNTWAFIGATVRFWFPGAGCVDGRRPDAIRRVQGAWATPHALIMPRRYGVRDDELELVVTLAGVSMEVLESDQNWMGLVKRVVG